MSNEELQILKDKAAKWDALDAKIEKLYMNADGSESEDDADLGDVGELAAIAFGYL